MSNLKDSWIRTFKLQGILGGFGEEWSQLIEEIVGDYYRDTFIGVIIGLFRLHYQIGLFVFCDFRIFIF